MPYISKKFGSAPEHLVSFRPFYTNSNIPVYILAYEVIFYYQKVEVLFMEVKIMPSSYQLQ